MVYGYDGNAGGTCLVIIVIITITIITTTTIMLFISPAGLMRVFGMLIFAFSGSVTISSVQSSSQ